MTLRPLALALVLSTVSTAAAKKPDLPLLHERLGRYWMLLAPIELEAGLGLASGWENRDDGGALIEAALSFEPQLRWRKGRFRLKLPLDLAHRQTLGFDLPETHMKGGLSLSWRLSDTWTLESSFSASRTSRPGWPDLYQPILDSQTEPTGALRNTDRYSESSLRTSASLAWAPSDLIELRLRASADRLVNDKDENFDPILSPTHLTPLDRDHWRLQLSVETEPVERRLDLDLDLDLEGFDYAYAFSRDAGTGETHANLGGLPSNPLQSFTRFSASPRLSVWFPDLDTRLYLDLHYAHNEDHFQDYYTWNAVGGDLRLKVKATSTLEVIASYAVDLRSYTHEGYAESASHAPLDEGEVRQRTAHEVHLEATLDLGDLEPFASVDWTHIDDTMPDYEPWENPPTSPYDIDFDADWSVFRAGMRAKF